MMSKSVSTAAWVAESNAKTPSSEVVDPKDELFSRRNTAGADAPPPRASTVCCQRAVVHMPVECDLVFASTETGHARDMARVNQRRSSSCDRRRSGNHHAARCQRQAR